MHQHAPRTEAQRRLDEIRDARAGAGHDLSEVARRSRIPLALLEELERGDLSRWPRALYGRTQLVRYARAAGLDPDWVVAAVTPLLEPQHSGRVIAEGAGAPPPATDGRIAIIASSFDDGEELFAPEERQPVPAKASESLAAAAPIREQPGPNRPPVLRQPGTTAHPSAPPFRVHPAALGLAAAALCVAALWSHGPLLQRQPEGQLESWGAVTAPSPAAASHPRPHPPADRSAATGPVSRHPAAPASRTAPRPPISPEPSAPITAEAAARVDSRPEQPDAGTAPLASDAADVPKDETGEASRPPTAAPPLAFTGAHPAEGLGGDAVMYSPAFASSGDAIYFQRESGRRSALMRADTDPDGRVVRVAPVIDDGARNFHVRPSPDGESIAFDSDRDGTRGVYVASAGGKRVRKVSGGGYAAVPSWSPDGRSLIFVKAEPSHPQVWNLWQLTIASGEPRRLTSYRVGQPWGASWFPDGRRVAYSHENALVVLNLDTGLRQVYESPRGSRLVRTPAVSPSGREILFQVFRDGVWMLDVSSGAMHRVLDDASAEEYTWSPDGKTVAYHSRRSGRWGLWLVSAH